MNVETNGVVTIPFNGVVNFYAKTGGFIDLNQNFETVLGALFNADIFPCPTPVNWQVRNKN